MITRRFALLWGIVLLLLSALGRATPVVLDDRYQPGPLGLHLEVLEDPSARLNVYDVVLGRYKDEFQPSRSAIPGFGFGASAWWLRLHVQHRGERDGAWLLEFQYAPLQFLDVYLVDGGNIVKHQRGGVGVPFSVRSYPHHSHAFPLNLTRGTDSTILIRVAGSSSKILPVYLWPADMFSRHTSLQVWGMGLYFGITIGLMVYNLLIFAIVRDRIYLWYSLFLASFSVFGLYINGFGFQYFTSIPPEIAIRMVPFTMGLSGFLATLFTLSFLDIRRIMPSLYTPVLFIGSIPAVIMVMSFLVSYGAVIRVATVYTLMFTALFMSLGIACMAKGVRAARFYMLAWFAFLVGIVLFAMRSLGMLESNHLTEYGVWYGAALQAILLSLAIASSMRSMKEDKEEAQAALLIQLKDASHRLEMEVAARTEQLVKTQQELVQKEKMASVGVLAAGVAHEINNPNNFISVGAQNAMALNQTFKQFVDAILDDDVDHELRAAFDEKFDRMDSQLALIDEGSRRISVIVGGLQSVTHLNEAEQKSVDVIPGLENTVLLIEPQLKKGIQFDSDFSVRPPVPCWPAEINQIFMNVLLNACVAIQERPRGDGQSPPGQVHMSTAVESDSLVITITDNGVGMSEYVKHRAFDPFFTTRAVGSGSGLGLSTALDIAKKHSGRLELSSVEGQGTTVRIVLPLERRE